MGFRSVRLQFGTRDLDASPISEVGGRDTEGSSFLLNDSLLSYLLG